jgi:hypothetical protein
MNKTELGCSLVWQYGNLRFYLSILRKSGFLLRRMATDLNLHRKSSSTSPETTEGKARDQEVYNRERTWLVCFCLDRSTSAQMGKPSSIKEE